MDMRKDGWHGRLIISGIGQPETLSGSVMEIVAFFLTQLRTTNPRPNADGHKEITIQLSTSHLPADKGQLLSERVAEIESMIDWNAGEQQ